jgi:hypothetical protein
MESNKTTLKFAVRLAPKKEDAVGGPARGMPVVSEVLFRTKVGMMDLAGRTHT